MLTYFESDPDLVTTDENCLYSLTALGVLGSGWKMEVAKKLIRLLNTKDKDRLLMPAARVLTNLMETSSDFMLNLIRCTSLVPVVESLLFSQDTRHQ